MAVVYHDSDADLRTIMNRTLAVIGYGQVGRPLALNLRDSAFPVLVGNRADEYAERAYLDGFEVLPIADAAARADLLLMMLPGEVTPQVYLDEIAPSLRPGDTLVFASGYSVAFGFVEPPPFVDVVLIAPQATGDAIRAGYVEGRGFPSIVAVGQDVTGAAWARVLAVAKAVGALQFGAVELTFQQEAELDLFTQQAVLPALHSVMQTAIEVLSREGFPSEAALMSVYLSGELAQIVAQWADVGVAASLGLHSEIAQYGILSRIERFREVKFRAQMEAILEDIRRGQFAQEWAAEYADGYPRLEALRRRFEQLPTWAVERHALAQFGGAAEESE